MKSTFQAVVTWLLVFGGLALVGGIGLYVGMQR